MKRENIIVVTVTYNSSHFLKKLVKAVYEQTYKINRIVVVDNASSEEHENEIKKLSEKYLTMNIVRLKDNLGGAGGFQKGMEYVLATYPDCDWIWLMDDDAFPTGSCLENLLKYSSLEKAGCLTPLIYGVDRQKYQLYHHKLVSRYLDKDIPVVKDTEDINEFVSIDANAFVGPLLRMSVVKEVGIPDGSLFIYGDDIEYIYRISRVSKVYLVKSAIINHRDVVSSKAEVNPNGLWKEYYKYRNRFLFIEKYKSNTIKGYIGKTLVAKAVIREAISAIFNTKYKGLRRIKLQCLRKALFHGLRNKTGKMIDPVEFRKEIDKCI